MAVRHGQICKNRPPQKANQELNFLKAAWGETQSQYRSIWIELPGDAYSRFQNHPARLRFKKKVDAADKD